MNIKTTPFRGVLLGALAFAALAFGSPRLATAARGKVVWNAQITERTELALRILDGLDLKTIPRHRDYKNITDPGIRDYTEDGDKHEKAILEKQRAWLEKNEARPKPAASQ